VGHCWKGWAGLCGAVRSGAVSEVFEVPQSGQACACPSLVAAATEDAKRDAHRVTGMPYIFMAIVGSMRALMCPHLFAK
jgi:hypothetical protein